jgi:hypothetical protein
MFLPDPDFSPMYSGSDIDKLNNKFVFSMLVEKLSFFMMKQRYEATNTKILGLKMLKTRSNIDRTHVTDRTRRKKQSLRYRKKPLDQRTDSQDSPVLLKV